MLTHLSLFSGIGGLDIAAEMAGFKSVGQCEWAPYPRKVLEKHWPDVPRWKDIRTLTGGDFFERTGLRTVDVISGGFPCQPFSLAGQRKGTADDRYLWPEMCRVIQEIKPAWVIGENVPGLVSMAEPVGDPAVEGREIARNPGEDNYHAVLVQQDRMLLDGILKDLESAGYDVQPFIVPACAVDAPHRRDRLAIVAHANSRGCGESRICGEQPWRAEAFSAGETMADADREPCAARAEQPMGRSSLQAARSGERRENVADAEGEQREGTMPARRRGVDLQTAVHLFPTPTAQDAKNSTLPESQRSRDSVPGYILRTMFPTPTTGAGLCGGTGNYQQLQRLKAEGKITEEERRNMSQGNGGQLNPTWVEWLMGYPTGWTDLGASETR